MDDTLSRLSGQKQGTAWLFQEQYLGLSRVVQRQYGATGVYWTVLNSSGSYTGLDRYNRIQELKVTNFTTTKKHFQHTYNYQSQVLLREDIVGNVGGSYEFDELYDYDKVSRLSDHKRGVYANGTMSTIRLHECWTLERSGNTTASFSGTSSGCTPSTSTATYNGSNEIATWSPGTVTYDDVGNCTRRGSYYFTYDAWNRLTMVKWTTIELSSYEYNGLGHKTARTGSSLPNLEYYYTEDWQMLDEIKETDGSVYNWYIWGTQYIDDMVVQKASGTTQYTVRDANFNRVAVLDSSAAPVSHLTFQQYGDPKLFDTNYGSVSITDDMYAFTNRQYHKDHQQNDFRNRMEAPEVYFFIQRDPIGTWGDKGNFGNGYAYVGNDPTNLVDPKGTELAVSYQIAQFRLNPLESWFYMGLRLIGLCNEEVGREVQNEVAAAGIQGQDDPSGGNSFQHRLASCRSCQKCGKESAEQFWSARETNDPTGDKDLMNNEEGYDCCNDTDCWTCCMVKWQSGGLWCYGAVNDCPGVDRNCLVGCPQPSPSPPKGRAASGHSIGSFTGPLAASLSLISAPLSTRKTFSTLFVNSSR
jgi:RHS repeat-associated protein